MLKDRRKFIVATGMAASGVLVAGLNAANNATTTPEDHVANLVSKYGAKVGGAQLKGDVICLKVKVSDRGNFSKIFTEQSRNRLDSVIIRPGNQMDLICRGQKFVISHVA